jgi:hypothetical protein
MKSKNKTGKSESLVIIPFKSCICCGKTGRLKHHTFEYHQASSIAQFAKLAGNGIDTILGYVLTKTFTVQALFCGRCGKRIEKVDFIGQLYHLVFVLIIFLTIVLSISVDSLFGFGASLYSLGLGVLTAIGFRIWCRYYNWKYFPKIQSINEKFVVLKIPGKGKTKLSRT